jgi:UDP-N-acetylglucosamine transferase subunit ALG13
VILATVGTHGQPFARFLDLLSDLDDEVVLQYGHNPKPEGFAKTAPFMAFDEMVAFMHAADAVVTHAGVGSILVARDAGHVPVVVPRLARLGEHVDDHQAELTRTLEERGHVVAVWDQHGLPEAVIAAAARRNGGYRLGERPLHAAVRAALLARVPS